MEIVGVTRAVASRVGAAVLVMREMRAAADDRGQRRSSVQAAVETIVTKNLVKSVIRIT